MLPRLLSRLSLLPFLPLLLLLAACEPESGPNDPDNTGTEITVAMSEMTDLPRSGGDVTGVAFGPDNVVYAIIDGKLYKVDGAGSVPQLVGGDAGHLKVAVGPTGEIYTVTAQEFRTYAPGSSTPTAVPFEAGGLGRIEDAKIVISPAGVPFVVLVTNYPRTHIYYSLDKGATWTPLSLPNSAASFQSTGDVAFTGSGVLIAGNYQGLWRSTDVGAAWTQLNSSMPNAPIKLMTAPNGDIYRYTHAGGGLDVSRDGGINFTPLTEFNKPPFFIQVAAGNTGALYALANSSSGGGATPLSRPMSMYRSTDGGATWQRRSPGQAHEFAMRGTRIALGLAVAPHDYRPGGLSISEDLGKTWELTGTGSPEQIESFSFDADGNLLIRADGGMFRRVSGKWNMLGSPWGMGPLASSSAGGMIVGGTGEQLFSPDDGESWRAIAAVGGSVLALRDGGFLVYNPDGIDRVSPGGEVTNLYRGMSIKRIVEDANGILYGVHEFFNDFTAQYESEPYRSTDGGATWLQDQNSLPAYAFNSMNKLFGYGELGSYVYGGADKSSRKKVAFTGFNVPPNLVAATAFDRDDRLWILSMEGDLYSSGGALR